MCKGFSRLLFFSLFLCCAVADATELSNYRADVTVVRHGAIDIKAKGSTSFTIDENNNWQITLSAKGSGLKSEEISKGFFADGVFKPVSYRKRSKFMFLKEKIDWHFDWPNQRVKGKVKKDKRQYPTGESLHDPLSFQAAMRQALINNETQLKYRYLRYNRPQDLAFEVIGEELLNLQQGRVHTLIVKELEPLARVDKSLVWVATDFDYVPVRFANYKKGKLRDEITITELWIDGEKVNFSAAK